MGIFKKMGARLFGAAPKQGTTETAAESAAKRKALADAIGRETAGGGPFDAPEYRPTGFKGLAELAARTREKIADDERRLRENAKPQDTDRKPRGGLEGFLRGTLYDTFTSSNVHALQYDPAFNELYVQFQAKGGGPGRWYKYLDVSDKEATGFYYAASKGRNAWDVLRHRGVGNSRLSKKTFVRDQPPPGYLPL